MPEIDIGKFLTLMLANKKEEEREPVSRGEMMIVTELEMLRKMLEDAPIGGLSSHTGGG